MDIDFGWFLPTMGDSEIVGPPTREATLDYLTTCARTAEDAGFGFMLVPVGTTCEDAWLAAQAVAARAEKMRFLVAMRPGFVSPTVAAKMSNTFDHLSEGRIIINVVTGGFPHEQAADGDFMEHDERYARTQEFMQVVNKAWLEPRSWSHEGKYYKVEKGNVFPKPYQKPRPPWYFGGASDEGKRVGAEEADVYLLWGETIPMVRERIADMRERAAKLGRTLRFGIRLLVIARETDEEAMAAAEALVAHVPDDFEGKMKKHQSGADSEGEKRQRALRDQGDWVGPNMWTGIGRARLGVGLALVGSGENVAARIKEYVAEGIDTFIFSSYPDLEESQRFGQYVMPHFEKSGQRVSLSASQRGSVFDRDALNALVDYTDFTWETYRKVAARLPAEALTQPIDGSGWPALSDALFHVASAWDGWLRDEIGASDEVDEDRSKATSLEYINAYRTRTRAWMRQALGAASDDDLQRRDVAAFADETLATKGEIFAHILLHERGHHGDVATLLSALGVTPPDIDYMTYLWFRQRKKQ